MFRKKLIIVEDDEIVAEDEGCRVGEDSEHLGHQLAAPPSQDALRQRQVEQERLHAGHLEVGERVGVQVVGEAVADLILQSQYTVQPTDTGSQIKYSLRSIFKLINVNYVAIQSWDLSEGLRLFSLTHPPLLVAHHGEIKVIFPPLAVLLSKVEPVVSAVV